MQEAAAGREPSALRNRPRLDVRQVRVYNAFQSVTGSRNASMSGVLPIPISEIRAYCDLYQIRDAEKIETLVERIQFLDGVYLEHVAEKSKSQTKK